MAEKFFPRTASGLVRTISPYHALIFAVLNMLIGGALFTSVMGTFLFPGNNLPLSYLIPIAPSIFVGLLYVMLSIAMPRTGGDYIWVGRILHPAIGFMTNFYLTFLFLSFIGFIAPLAWTLVMSDTVISIGLATNNDALIALGQSWADPMMGYYVGAIIILLAGLLPILGTRASTKIMVGMFTCNLIAYALLVLVFLTGGRETFIQGLAARGINYAEVINAAREGGALLGFTIIGTLLGATFAFQNSWGYTNPAYFVGELKAPKMARSQMIAVLGSLIVLLLLGAGIFATLYHVVGSDFFISLVWAWGSGSEAYKLPYAMPTPLALMGYITNNVPLIWATGLLWFIGFLAFPVSVIFVFSRNFFAWSFDRVLPARFSTLSRRTGAPWLCVILAIIVAEVWNFLYAQTTLAAYLVYVGIGWSIAWVIVGLAGALFPYRRKDLFEAAPGVVKKKVGGVPLVSIFGVITMAYSLFMGYAIATPEFTGILPIEAALYSTLLVTILLATGPIIYTISYIYHKRKGVELRLAHKELPVE